MSQRFKVTKSWSAKHRWTGGFISVLQCSTQEERRHRRHLLSLSQPRLSSAVAQRDASCPESNRGPAPIQRRHLWLILQVLSHCGSEPIFKSALVCVWGVGGWGWAGFWRDKDKPLPFACRCRLGRLTTPDSMSICILRYENRRSAGRANVAVESTASVSTLVRNINNEAKILMEEFLFRYYCSFLVI